ncbi:MAG: hypothetical protein ACFFBP_18165 [Promethearchaeota archaeon]
MNFQKRNYFVYFSVYLIVQVIFVYVNQFLPIYYANVSEVNITELGIVLLVSFSFLFAKPLLSIYFDKKSRLEQSSTSLFNKKTLLILGAVGAILSFIIFLLNLEFLVIFTIFLGLNLAFLSLMDVSIDKIILAQSINESMKNKSAFYLQFGSVIGAIISSVYYFFLDDVTSLTSWRVIFITGIITIITIFPTIFLLKEIEVDKTYLEKDNTKNEPIILKNVILMSTFIFLTYGTLLYDWMIDPWAVGMLEPQSLYAIFQIIFIFIDVISLLLAGKFIRKFNKRKLLLITVFFSGLLTSIAPLFGIFMFFVLISIREFISGFYLIGLTTLLFDISHKKVLPYQIMASFAILAKVILSPLGLTLWGLNTIFGLITGEIIILIAGILQILSVIPLYFIK